MMAVSGAPWQLECEKVEQRCGYLLTSGLWSDCNFMVGSETNQEMSQAHKLVLAMASPVFEAMFYGGLSEHNDLIIPIPDVQPEAFRALLQYIYTGNINIDSIEMALDLWYGAQKYMLPHLITECNSYIGSVLSPKNACRAYEFAHLFDDKILIDKCLTIISTNTKEVLNDSSFEDVELNTVITMCSLDHLNVDSELDLFNAVARYAKAEQRRKEQMSDPQMSDPSDGGPAPDEVSHKMLSIAEISQRSRTPLLNSKTSSEPTTDKENLKEGEPTIRAALQKIRFLSLTAQEFADGPARSGLLTEGETLAMILNIASTDSTVPMPIGFSECRECRKPRDSKQICFEVGSLEHTINALKCGDPEQVEKEQCFQVGSLEHTINALKCGNPKQVMQAVFSAVRILRTPHNIQPALDKGILDALVPALTEGDDECKQHTGRAISAFCAWGSASQLSVLAVSEALEPYCRLLTGAGDYTCYWVLNGLTYLLKKVEQDTKVGLISKLREIGVPQLLTSIAAQPKRAFLFGQKDRKRVIANNLLRTYFSGGQ